MLWVVGQLAGALVSRQIAPFLIAVWAATLARECRRPDPLAPRRVQVRLAWLNGAFFLFAVVPYWAGKARSYGGAAGVVFGVIYAAAIVLHLVAWARARREP